MIQHQRFANGVRLVVDPMPEARSISLGLWIGAGSRLERPEFGGISHFIEHMLFKGTGSRTAKQIAQEMDAMGGQLNAFTSKEQTCYHTRVLDRFFASAAEMLGDMFFHSSFDDQAIVKEKSVVGEEIKMMEDAPEELVHELLSRAFWGGDPLSRPVLGTWESVSSLDRSHLRSYVGDYYRPERMVLAVAGKTTLAQASTILGPIFGQYTAEPLVDTKAQETMGNRTRLLYRAKTTEQVHLCLGLPGLAVGDERIYAMQLLSNCLGGSMSSRLFQSIREERGLAYSVYTYHLAYRGCGMFAIYAGTTPEQGAQVVELMRSELNQVVTDGITELELSGFKEQMKIAYLMSLESGSSRMHRIGRAELAVGQVLDEQEVLQCIEAVKAEDLQALATAMLRTDPVIVAVGPEHAARQLEVLV